MQIIYKFIIMLILSFLLNVPSYAFGNNDELISKLENNLYGFDYQSDSTQNRVSRLEKTIYGKVSTGDINKRIKKLSGDISADVIGLEITPTEDTFLAEEQAEEDGTVDYPIVNEIEQKLFNQTYKNRDFHTRIVTIEKKLFGKIYDVEDYSSRMDRIKAKMMPEINLAQKDNADYNYEGSYYDNDTLSSLDFSKFNRRRVDMPYGQQNYTREYSNFGNYENLDDNEKLNEEVAKMEYDVFGTEFSNESIATRLKRLNSVQKAKKSSKKYDSQKFQQRMSTAMEIGAMILMILAMVL